MDHENIYYQVVQPELSSNELACVDAWLDEADEEDTAAFFEAAVVHGPRQACEHCGIDLKPEHRDTELSELAGLHVLVKGNVEDGFRVYGPFQTDQEALASDYNGSGTVMKLRSPEDLE
jgi:hypothetical protein